METGRQMMEKQKGQTDKWTDRNTHRQRYTTDTQRCRETETDRQTDRLIDRQTDRQTDRQRYNNCNSIRKEIKFNINFILTGTNLASYRDID